MTETFMRHVAWLAAGVMLAGCVVTPAPYAQANTGDAYGQAAVDSVPAIAGRLSAVQGDVRVWRTDEDGRSRWDDAQVNDVVTTGSQLWTQTDARTEVRFGPHVLRVAGNSQLRFDQLDEHRVTVRLERGTVAVRLHRNDYNDTLSVVSGARTVELHSPGRYRIEGNDRSSLRVTSFRGEAAVRAGDNSLAVHEGKSLDVSPDGTSLYYGEAVSTAIDEWSLKRDERLTDTPTRRYVSPYMTGYEDLDAYGDWIADGTYGTVWVPRVVVAGWAPYRYGRWRWIAPWGWTWVDEAPWGFAPFHYGRWVYVGAQWCWWPGAYVARPVYAPALVGWVGSTGWSVSIGVGSPAYVGWYPLAPWHVYQPGYISNVQYSTVINQTVINPPTGVSLNQNLAQGGTAVPGKGFHDPIRRGGQPIDHVLAVRDVQAMPPPSGRMVPRPELPRAGRGEVQPAAPQVVQPPRPAFDRVVPVPGRQPEPGPPQQAGIAKQPPAALQPAPEIRMHVPREPQLREREGRGEERPRGMPVRPAQPVMQAPQPPQVMQPQAPRVMPPPQVVQPPQPPQVVQPQAPHVMPPPQVMQAPPAMRPQPPMHPPVVRGREPEGRQQQGERERGEREGQMRR